jgi:wyosine [tRNA(Phe)-imidazoG37] synthetase (radical SAM superfamily)
MTAPMTAPQFKHIYGPVYSWRIGMSLGIDPLNTITKYCNFDCSYCQLGPADALPSERDVFVPVDAVVEEIKALGPETVIDYLTFSGNGEPTLAANLGSMIQAVRDIRGDKVAVITNASTINIPQVRAALSKADLVLFKMDAADEAVFNQVNRAYAGIKFADIVRGIKEFRKTFTGRTALQLMFVNANKAQAQRMAALARDISPDEVQLNTPLRPGGDRPLSASEMDGIKAYFTGLQLVRSVYEEEKKDYVPLDVRETEKRHGKFRTT